MTTNHVPNSKRREESDAKIINAAIKDFGIYGYSHCSISQIAKDAGVSPGLITNRYASKEELFEHAFYHSFKEINIDNSKISEGKDFLIESIKSIVELYSKNTDIFSFMTMIYVGYDLPECFKIRAKEEFKSTEVYNLFCKAQNDGILQKGDIIKLVDVFLAHAYIQIGICKRYGVEIPSNDYFLSAILSENIDEDEFYNRQLMNVLLKEFQSTWLIKVNDLTLKIYKYDEDKAVPNSVQIAQNIKTYNEARLWYIENYVAEQSREKMLEETKIENVISKVKYGNSFFVEYIRTFGEEQNYNQLCFDKVINRKGDTEYISMGFRNIDTTKKAELDELTGLLTRRSFFDKAEEILKNNPDKHYDIVMSDIIDFKKINETYGVKTADMILKWQGEYLGAFMSETLLVGRYGGDQMVMFGEHDQIEEKISPKSKAVFAKAEKENGLPSTIVKLGIYLNVRKDKSVVSSCDRAHTALNSIKYHYSKDIAYYNDEIRNQMEKQRRIEESMNESLENNDFKVYYQPKHDAKTGKLVGAEALIRWVHPKYGFMSPADFIPLFEQNGFIVKSDQYVWDRTCENLKKWKNRQVNTVPISVNASRLTMLREDLIDIMKQSIKDNDLLPNQLHVEITETLMTENTEALVEVLNKIREFGCEVELDDFGSGYSSLNVLSTFPIDILKLDMSFLQQFGDEKRTVVLESCIDMAQKLGFTTVSEGVELERQKDVLGKLGVDMIQGYYYSKPLPEDEFERYLLEHQA